MCEVALYPLLGEEDTVCQRTDFQRRALHRGYPKLRTLSNPQVVLCS